MLEAVVKYAFLRNAVISAFLASIVCGVVGTVIVEKKLVMMSGGISHASFGGVGLGYLLGFEPMLGALLTAVLSALGLAYVKHNVKTGADTLAGIIWPLGMSAGILFIYVSPGYPPDLTSYLFGDILTVTSVDLFMIGILNLIVLAVVISYFQLLKAYLFDKEFGILNGINAKVADYILYLFIGLSVVVLIRVVGIILVMALLTIPSAVAKMFTFKFHRIMIFSALFGMIICIGGLSISYVLNIPSGSVIVLAGGFLYIVAAFLKKILERKQSIFHK